MKLIPKKHLYYFTLSLLLTGCIGSNGQTTTTGTTEDVSIDNLISDDPSETIGSGEKIIDKVRLVTDQKSNIYVAYCVKGTQGFKFYEKYYIVKYHKKSDGHFSRDWSKDGYDDENPSERCSKSMAVANNNLYVTGFKSVNIESQIVPKYFVTGYDLNGNELWDHIDKDGDQNHQSIGMSIVSNNNYVYAVYAKNYFFEQEESYSKYVIQKYDASGELISQNATSSQNSLNYHDLSMVSSPNGNLYVTGIDDTVHGFQHYFIDKYNESYQQIFHYSTMSTHLYSSSGINLVLYNDDYYVVASLGVEDGYGLFVEDFYKNDQEVNFNYFCSTLCDNEMVTGVAVDKSGVVYVSGNEDTTHAFVFKYHYGLGKYLIKSSPGGMYLDGVLVTQDDTKYVFGRVKSEITGQIKYFIAKLE